MALSGQVVKTSKDGNSSASLSTYPSAALPWSWDTRIKQGRSHWCRAEGCFGCSRVVLMPQALLFSWLTRDTELHLNVQSWNSNDRAHASPRLELMPVGVSTLVQALIPACRCWEREAASDGTSLTLSSALCITAETWNGGGGSFQRGSGAGRGLLLAAACQAGGAELHMAESLCLTRWLVGKGLGGV